MFEHFLNDPLINYVHPRSGPQKVVNAQEPQITVTTPKREHRSECAEAAQREGRAHEKLLGNIMTNLTVCRMSVIFCGSLSGRCLA